MQTEIATESSMSLMDQVIQDINAFIQNNGSIEKGLEKLSLGSGISERTILRYIKREVMPQRKALRKLYETFTGALDEVELQKRIPDVVFNRIFMRKKRSTNDAIVYSLDLNKEFLYNSIFRALYIKACTGPFYREEAEFRFGQEAKETIKMMLQKKVLSFDEQNRLVLGENELLLNGEAFKILASDLITKNFYPEKEQVLGENSYSWSCASLNLEGYNELLKVDSEYFNRKEEVLNNPKYKGEIKTWALNAVDTFTDKKLYPDDWKGEKK
jgi:hypothetical protein